MEPLPVWAFFIIITVDHLTAILAYGMLSTLDGMFHAHGTSVQLLYDAWPQYKKEWHPHVSTLPPGQPYNHNVHT